MPIFAKSRRFGSDSSSGSVGAKHTMLRIELYARKRLSGLSDASVIVHCPYGYKTDYELLVLDLCMRSDDEAHLVVLPVVRI